MRAGYNDGSLPGLTVPRTSARGMNAAPVLASAMLSPSSSLPGQGTGLCAGGQSKSVGMTAAPAYGATILPGSGNSSGGFSIGGSFSGGGGLSAGGGAPGW